MRYRTFGKLDWRPSALGFGAMRMPVIDDDTAKIDEAEATRMVRYAIDHGVNYVDTAYPYHSGKSEPFLGRALQDGYRERVKLATKLPCWKIEEAGDFDQYFDEQLEKLQTGHIDFYLLHALGEKSWPKMRDLGVLDWAQKQLDSGRVRYLGFSFHDEIEVFEEIVDATDMWTFCQIQYNFMDVEYQAGARGLKYAADRGLAVVVMEPIRGGKLVKDLPDSIRAIWDESPTTRTPADAALQWVWNQPEVSLLLSGMSTMEQVEQNIASAEQSAVGSLTAEELAVYDRVREEYERICPVPCTDCKYCMPCPSGVDIPRVFQIYNDLKMYRSMDWAEWAYNTQLGEKAWADLCTNCGECLEKCPQMIEIPDWLAEAHEVLYKEPDASS